MSILFIKGPSGAGKTTELYRQIVERSQAYPQKTFLLIVPEQNNLAALKELISLMPGKGILNVDVLGFNRLAHRIFDEAGGNDRQILDDTAKSLILRHLTNDFDEKLRVLSKNIKKPGYIQEVKSVISEFMQYDITIPKLQQMMSLNQDNPVLYNKLSDITVIFEAFNNYLKDRYITTEEILDRAYELCPKADFLQNCELYLDGYTGFTPVQIRFLDQLMQRCDRIVATATIGDADKDLFGLGLGMEAAVKDIAKEQGILIEEDIVLQNSPRLEKVPELAFLEKNIFRFNGRKFYSKKTNSAKMDSAKKDFTCTNAEKISPDDNDCLGDNKDGLSNENDLGDKNKKQDLSELRLQVCEYPGIADEVFYVAQSIRDRVAKGDIRYKEIAILTGSVENYADLVRKEFAKLDIPVFVDENIDILLNPFCEMIEASLQCVISDFSYESVLRFLRCGLADFTKEEADELDNYIRAAGVKRLYQYNKEWTYVPRYMGRKDNLSNQALIRLEKLNECRKRLISTLGGFSKGRKKAVLHCTDLYNFILVNDVYKKICALRDEFDAKGDLAKVREYDQIYDKVMELLDKIVDFIGEEEMTLQEFLDELLAGLSAIEVGIIPPGIDRVTLADMTRSRISDIKVLYVLGCNDGMIPKDSRKGGLLSEDERERLFLQDIVLSPTAKQMISQDRFYIYMNLTKASERLNISYPLLGEDGEPLKPSSLINEIKKIYPDLKIDKRGKKTIENTGFSLPMNFYNDCVRTLPKNVSNALYGKVLTSSVTRLEQFASCPYAHFLKYGLSLKEAEEFGFAVSDLGTIYHDILQKYSENLRDSEYDWFNVPQDTIDSLIDDAVEYVVLKNKDSALFESSRSEYMLKRIRRIINRSIEVLNIQIRHGEFVPYQYEVGFGIDNGLSSSDFALSDEEKIRIIGRIDRVDVCKDDQNLYVKIVDYKSGDKSFSLANVYHGLSLQLVIYLNAAMELMGKRNKGMQTNPAALLYYHVSDPIVERPAEVSEEAVKELVLKELKAKGLVNSDGKIIDFLDKNIDKKSTVIPVGYTKDGEIDKYSSVASGEEFEVIQSYVNQYIKTTAKSIIDGEISISPYKSKQKSGCDYCRYRDICAVDIKEKPFRDLQDMSKDEVIEKMMSQEN